MPLPDEALSVSIREYYFDWQPREPATFTIECLDANGPSAPFTSESLAFGLDEAATHLHRSLTYWNRYMLDARAEQTDNVFGGGYDVKRGLAAAKYAFCFFDLAPDEVTRERLAEVFAGRSACEWQQWADEHDIPLAAVAEPGSATP